MIQLVEFRKFKRCSVVNRESDVTISRRGFEACVNLKSIKAPFPVFFFAAAVDLASHGAIRNTVRSTE